MNPPGLHANDAPSHWVDQDGLTWKTKSGRLKYKSGGAFALRRFVFERDKFTCQRCGWVADMKTWDGTGESVPMMTGTEATAPGRFDSLLVCLELDHILPVARGGSSHPDNLWALCSTCNAKKGNGP